MLISILISFVLQAPQRPPVEMTTYQEASAWMTFKGILP